MGVAPASITQALSPRSSRVTYAAYRAGTTGAPRRQVPARLTTTSGGFAIGEARPSGEPVRTSCSAQGLPSPELDPASRRWGWPFVERRSGVVRKERSQEQIGARQ